MKVLAAVGLAAVLAGCASPSFEPEPGSLASRCGRFSLRLGTVEWRRYHEKQVRPVLTVQAIMDGLGPDLPFLGAHTRWRTLPDERRSPQAGGVGYPQELPGAFVMQFEPMMGEPLVLKRVQVECRILRVFAWTDHSFPGIEPGSHGPYAAPPYSVGIFGEADRVRSTSGVMPELGPSDHGVADAGFLGGVWAGRNVTVTDANGRVLARMFPKENWMADHVPESGPVAYPVRVDLRIPERYVVETVTFDVEEIVVPPIPADLPIR